MKTITLVASIMIVLSISLCGCSDKSANLVSGPQQDVTSLAASSTVRMLVPELTRENVKEFCAIKEKEGWDGVSIVFSEGKAAVVTLQKEVSWDGRSPMEPGVLYAFSSEEKLLAAEALTKDALSADGEGVVKSKEDEGAKLAAGSWWADIGLAQTGQWSLQIYADIGNPSLVGGRVTHKLLSRRWFPFSSWITSQEVFNDCVTAESSYFVHFHQRDPDAERNSFQGEATAWDDAVREAWSHVAEEYFP